MTAKNAIYAQSGGVTSVINVSACAVIETAKQYPEQIGKVFAAENGIIGALEERLLDTYLESDEAIAGLMYTPAGAFGSCRHKLKSDSEAFARLIEVFKAHNIGYFFYNGGGDSMDTADKVSRIGQELGYPITCIGIPKTVDNDLPFTDHCPGFGSVAKYVAVSTKEAGFDVQSMAASSTKVFILEVMGRHAGWIAASSVLAKDSADAPPHIILLPEVAFNEGQFLAEVKRCVEAHGYCVVVASEGIRYDNGQFISESGLKDAFGHAQLGGVAPILAGMVKDKLGLKYHWAVADYLQRSARHISSMVDVEQAYALGAHAVKLAVEGINARMPIVVREQDWPYRYRIEDVALSEVANQERKIPDEFISSNGMGVTDACIRYLKPLIQGESYPSYIDGMPVYTRLAKHRVAQKLPAYSVKK